MKKLHVLIPSLVATASMPLISVVGCGNQDPVKPTETYVVTLFAGQGTFGESNQIILSNIQPGTLLKDVEGYKTPQGESFIGWLNNGKEFAVDQPINSNMLLTAKYNDPQAIHTITLFAGQGMFSDGNNVKKVSVTGDQTTLEQAIGDIEPIGATKFHGWITSTGGQPTMTDPIITDIELSAEYEPAVVKYKAYIVKTDDKNITLDNEDVTAGQQFTTTVEYSAGNISPENISIYVNGTLVNPTKEQTGEHKVSITLTGAQTTGDVAIVVKFETTTNNYSYLCNDPADGLTLTDSEIQPSATTIGTLNSPVNIENNWELDKVVMGGVDVTDNFELAFDETDDKKATINIVDSITISDDVLVWLKATTPSLDWVYEDGPFEDIVPLPSTVPYDQALEQFYEFALTDKLNIVKDLINARFSEYEESYLTATVSQLSFDPVDEVFTCNWNFAANEATAEMIYGKVENLKFKVVKSSDGKYETKGLPSLMSLDDAYNFLTNDYSWSISGMVIESGQPTSYSFDANATKLIWDTQKWAIPYIYDIYCLSHPIYYLQNITPGP